MISFIQKNLYTYFAIYIVSIIEYREVTGRELASIRVLHNWFITIFIKESSAIGLHTQFKKHP